MDYFNNSQKKNIYENINKIHRNFLFKENLISNPLVLASKYVEKLKTPEIINFPVEKLQTDSKFKLIASETCEDYQINSKTNAPFLKNNHSFFWTNTYNPNPIVPFKIWGSNPKYLSKTLKIQNEKIIPNRTLFPKRAVTKQSSRLNRKLSIADNFNFSQKNSIYIPSISSSNLKETLNYANDIEEFEYNVPKIVKDINFIDRQSCPHSMTNIRKKEAILFEKMKEKSLTKKLKDPFLEFEKKFKLKKPKKFDTCHNDNLILNRAIFEQNFLKSRQLMGRSLQNFKK